MRAILVITILAFCLFPTLGFAEGNPSPVLVLIIRDSPSGEPPDDACVYPSGQDPYDILECYHAKPAAGSYAFISVHAGRTRNGFTGLPFGIKVSGSPVTFLEFVPCPGYVLVLSQSGIPSAILVTSTVGCRLPREAVGYLKYVCADTNPTFFEIVPNADFGHFKVINCDYTYDEGTINAGSVQWGHPQMIVCSYVYLHTEACSWGKIKSLFR